MATPPAVIQHLKDFKVVELRRYEIKPETRQEFTLFFESYFPEAFQHLGALVFGDFLERENPSRFSWLRGFHDMDSRLAVCQSFYNGPLWKEHGPGINELMVDSSDVLLLQPIGPERGVLVLPAVSPLREPAGARGALVAQLFPVEAGQVEAFASAIESTFAGYRATGAREAGVLVTLEVPNNFPRHPIRTDGPWLVWLGLVKDDAMLDRMRPLAQAPLPAAAARALRGPIETRVLDPGRRSRLRWLDAAGGAN
jgi:hypothetical protein